MKQFFEKESIQFVGLKNEDEFEKTKAQTSAQNALNKIKKMYKGDTNLVIHVKRDRVQGNKKRYSIRARVSWPGNFFEAKQIDWNFLSTTQAALLTLVREVKKKHRKDIKRKG